MQSPETIIKNPKAPFFWVRSVAPFGGMIILDIYYSNLSWYSNDDSKNCDHKIHLVMLGVFVTLNLEEFIQKVRREKEYFDAPFIKLEQMVFITLIFFKNCKIFAYRLNCNVSS